ncbi:MAG: type II toxin-antitoxin system RelE/ParE family toxin [Zoogloeaceae bacterium]|jgi:toxin ParE1/3/4|nr:type II toxin-antitoxin system RelE/ParE family toxin [Zoogloeaceae bacterium]
MNARAVKCILSPLAQADLDEIWNYTVTHWGVDQAERYLRDIQAATETLAGNPWHGQACEDIRPGYRKIPVGSHIIFYRLTNQGVDIVRVLHQRMDADSHL